MKRRVHKSTHNFLKQEFDYLESEGHLQEGQAKQLILQYEAIDQDVKQTKPLNIIAILLTIGAFLVGLGILSFVASNWSDMTSSTKYGVLLLLLAGFFITAKLLEEKRPYLSRAFYYIGIFAFGAELFYIGQLFHLGYGVDFIFLLWGIGILPLAFYRDDIILKFTSLAFVYLFIEMRFVLADDWFYYIMFLILPLMFYFGHHKMGKYRQLMLVVNLFVLYQFIQIQFFFLPMLNEEFPIVFLIFLPALFYLGHKILNKSILLFMINFLISIQALIGVAVYFTMNYDFEYGLAVVLIPLLFVGFYLTYSTRLGVYDLLLNISGNALHFFVSMLLTVPIIWEIMLPFIDSNTTSITAFAYGIAYAIYAVTLVFKNSLLGVAIVSILTLRFYIDLSLQFMNKSIALLIGGILLIGLGIWFERTRKGVKNNETDVKH